ncbi:MAG: PleD family two-component system response regulator [Oscillatoriales cyanobacterium RM2_1_1]|nr:PleD family two-component system response regulator [Oscillatoriales cyanobacterium SM2_3_0]NJO44679.1 PleD family two-component system response regulator [Oscillatoriales cyanobacterium RM2_1_1]
MSDHPSKGLILIIDDNSVNLSILAQMLVVAGFEYRVAADGESALESVQYEPPDLILLDVQMLPGIDGFEVCQHLKTNPATQDIPIIFMTALADPKSKVKGLSLGAVDYITKPFQKEEVIARVKIHLKIRFLVQELAQKQTELEHANHQLQRLATMDGLTQVANRHAFDQYLISEWKRSIRERRWISLVLCDVDYFKRYNDTYGHQMGDRCLQQVAQALVQAARRPADLVARYGGEEFALILPNTNPSGAKQVAELIQEEMYQLKIPHAQSDVSQYVTLSQGISSVVPTESEAVADLIRIADEALYEAKKQGRNKFILAPIGSGSTKV